MLKRRLIPFTVVLLGLGTLAACGPNPAPAPVNRTVKFYVDQVQYGDTVIVKDGQKVARPAVDPTKEEDEDYTYTFDNWYEAGEQTAYDFDTPVRADLDLFGKFTPTAKEYDLVGWVWGGEGGEKSYITEEESARIKTYFENKFEGKKVRVVFKYGMGSNAFNTAFNQADGTVDFAISGANISSGSADPSAHIVERIHMGDGWFSNDSRYFGIATYAPHYDLTAEVKAALEADGPDLLTFDKTSVNMLPESTAQITATKPAGDTRSITWTSQDTTICTVDQTGLITSTEKLGTTTVTAKFGFVTYTINVNVDKEYDLVAYVYGINGAKTPTTYITKDESDRMLDEFLDLDICLDKEVKWVYSTGLTNGEFNAFVNQMGDADVVVSGNKVNPADEPDESVAIDTTNGPKAKVGSGWFANTSRYTIIAASRNEEHLDLAKALYGLIKGVGPDYQTTVAPTEKTIEVGETFQLTATAYGEVTWESEDDDYVTVSDDGVIEGISATGEGDSITITATGENGKSASCEVIVTATPLPTYDLTVYVNSGKNTNITETQSNKIKAVMLRELSLDETDVKWTYVDTATDETGDEGFATVVNGAGDADLVIASSNIDSATVKYAINNIDPSHAKAKIDSSWYELSGRYTAVITGGDGTDNAILAYNMLKVTHPDEFTMKATSTLNVGGTDTICEDEDVVYSGYDTEIVSVEEGVVTALAVGETTITGTNGEFTHQCVVTVSAAPVVEKMLVVDILTGSNSTNIKITEADVAALTEILDERLEAAGADIEYTIKSDFVGTGANFWTRVNTAADVDVVFGANNLMGQTGAAELLAGSTFSVVKKGIEDTSRYVGVLARTPATHQPYAKMFIDAICGFTCDENVSLEVEATKTIAPTSVAFGVDMTAKAEFEVTEGDDVVSVSELGVITALKAGSATVTVTVEGFEKEIAVTVGAAEIKVLNVYMQTAPKSVYLTEDEINAIKAVISAPEGYTINWIEVTGKDNDNFSAYVNEQKDADIVIAHSGACSKITTKSDTPEATFLHSDWCAYLSSGAQKIKIEFTTRANSDVVKGLMTTLFDTITVAKAA